MLMNKCKLLPASYRFMVQVLTPRVKAFDTALSSLGSYVEAIYDITIIYDPTNQAEKGK